MTDVRDRLIFAKAMVAKALEDIHSRYPYGGSYSRHDASMENYLEGQICAYEHAIDLLNGEE